MIWTEDNVRQYPEAALREYELISSYYPALIGYVRALRDQLTDPAAVDVCNRVINWQNPGDTEPPDFQL